ncbi:hypothetical protein NE865_14384 [Phthorimaea operculella]|nr:hypothetical protein NE865_14384 [Phthorimaea operculella]
MKQFLVLVLFIIGVAHAVELKRGMRTTFGQGGGSGSTYYLPAPLYVSQAKAMGWTETPQPEIHLSGLVLYCPPENSFCVYFDNTGYIAASQIAVVKSQFTNFTLDWEVQGHQTWIVNGEEYWAIQQYFVNEEFLMQSKACRIASRDRSRTLQMDSIWVTSFYRELLEIPTAEDRLDSIWAKEKCFSGMGTHYYYNITNTVCRSDLLLPWFPMYYQGELVSTLWSYFGTYNNVDDWTDRFERPPSKMIRMNFPDTPECHLRLADDNTVSMHQYYIGNPWTIVCNGEE